MMNHEHQIGGRTLRSETTLLLFLRQDPHALAVLADAANDDLQQSTILPACATSKIPLPRSCRTLSDPYYCGVP